MTFFTLVTVRRGSNACCNLPTCQDHVRVDGSPGNIDDLEILEAGALL
jgi:hypothetical protein